MIIFNVDKIYSLFNIYQIHCEWFRNCSFSLKEKQK